MKGVAHLFSGSIETDKTEYPAAPVGIEPVRENSLIRSAKLPRARQHAAAVDPDWKPKCLTVFERNGLGGELGAAIERDRRAGKESGADPFFRNPRWQLFRVVQMEGVAIDFEGKRSECGDRINPAAAEQHESSLMRFAVFED